MKTVIFVGGPTACGKSTFVDNLNKKICNSIQYRRYQGFFDLANKKSIPKSEIFNNILSSEVDDWFVSVCKNSDIVISDVHYAIQMNRTRSNADIYQEYVPTISYELIKKLLVENIQIVAVFLTCPPEQCLKRAISRYNESKKDFRNAAIENYAEEKEWDNILSTGLVDGLKLNSEKFSVEQLTDQCLEYLKKYEETALKKIKKI